MAVDRTRHLCRWQRQRSGWRASGEKDDQVLKFTTQGKFLAQFGHQGKSGGSADTQNLGGPANLTVDSENNELYVADGYRNRRVAVIDTGDANSPAHVGRVRQ